MNYLIPISSYSKAPWGLSVLSRVTCIFTGIKISPSLWLRQYPDHYAFRAGQNLPDKEFRYLWTIIVIAAVHRGFISMLRCYRLTSILQINLTFRHWAGVSFYTSACAFAETCVFGKQLPGPIHCGSILFLLLLTYLLDHPFSRSYGVILPSSLTIVLSLTLEYSS